MKCLNSRIVAVVIVTVVEKLRFLASHQYYLDSVSANIPSIINIYNLEFMSDSVWADQSIVDYKQHMDSTSYLIV